MGRGLSVESQALSAHPRAACLVRTHAGQAGKPGAAPGPQSPDPAYHCRASPPRVLEDDLSAVGVADCRPGSGLCWVYHELCRRIPVHLVQFALFPSFSAAGTRPQGPGSPECRPSPWLLPGSQWGWWSPLTHKPRVPEPYWRMEGQGWVIGGPHDSQSDGSAPSRGHWSVSEHWGDGSWPGVGRDATDI